MQINKILGAMIVGGVFALTTNVTIAAESAEGVKEHYKMLVETLVEAQKQAAAGNEPACRDGIKIAKQHYKEVTGDAAGKGLQDAMKRVRDAQAECEKEGGAPAGAAILAEVVGKLKK
jgi:hypothetical protein